MKDLELIEAYMNSIKEELMIYHDSLSEKTLPYIKCLKDEYNCWEEDFNELNGKTATKLSDIDFDDDETEIDNNLSEAIGEFMAYKEYYDDYVRTNDNEKLIMSHQELQHFLNLMTDIFSEISDRCKDDVEGRTMVKNSIKTIYTNFG